MAESRSFSIAKKQRKPIPFTIDGDEHEYTFKPPKQAVAFLPIITSAEDEVNEAKVAFDWLSEGLSDDDNARIIARLKDPKDDLDIEDVAGIVNGLMEDASGERPTT